VEIVAGETYTTLFCDDCLTKKKGDLMDWEVEKIVDLQRKADKAVPSVVVQHPTEIPVPREVHKLD
jgi:hypothetical protein